MRAASGILKFKQWVFGIAFDLTEWKVSCGVMTARTILRASQYPTSHSMP